MKAPLLPRCRCVPLRCEESDKENSEAGGVQENKQRQEGDSSGNTNLPLDLPPNTEILIPLETHHEQTDG